MLYIILSFSFSLSHMHSGTPHFKTEFNKALSRHRLCVSFPLLGNNITDLVTSNSTQLSLISVGHTSHSLARSSARL